MDTIRVIYFVIINIMSFYYVKQVMEKKKAYNVVSCAILVKETKNLVAMNEFNNALYNVALIKFVIFAIYVCSVVVAFDNINILIAGSIIYALMLMIIEFISYKINCIKFKQVDMEQFFNDLELCTKMVEKGEYGKLKN